MLFAGADLTNDFFYRPYPILLVHGFNTYVGGTWGINTDKPNREEYKANMLSTQIRTIDRVWEEGNAKKVDFGQLIMESFPKAGYLDRTNPNNNGFDPQDYHDFWQDVTSIVQRKGTNDIWEEDSSYHGINHSFVEVYCPYYFNESDDATDVNSPVFKGNSVSGGADYDISGDWDKDENPTNYGGQTKLVRIRIIQVLNEYYGPWQWVHDPTAKINIVCHSNGGLIVTDALKHDEEYQTRGYGNFDGNSSNVPWTTDNLANGYDISGRYFRLSDHINKVITVNSPLNGSPLADKNGRVPPFVQELLNSVSTVGEAELFWGTYGPRAQGLSAIVGPGGAIALLNYLSTYFAGGAIGNFDSPVMKDLGEGSSFNSYLKGDGLSPTFSPEHFLAGAQIPYINYTSTAEHLMPFSAGAMAICLITAQKNLIYPRSWWFPFPNPALAAPWFNMAHQLAKVTDWFSKSDAIVPIESQDMRNIYSDSKRKIRNRHDAWHSEAVNKNRYAIRSELNSPMTLSITNAIGENQANSTKANYEVISRTYDNYVSGINYPNSMHPIVKFTGFCSSTGTDLWPGKNADNVISMDATSGKPKTIVGIFSAYFLNRANLNVKVNNGPWQPLAFNKDYGDFACRFVDRNNDGKIDNNDSLEGAYIFADVNPDSFKVGENIITFKLFPCDSQLSPSIAASDAMFSKMGHIPQPLLSCQASVLYGNPIMAFESDADGNKLSGSGLIKRVNKWNYAGGETKTVYVSFNRRVSDVSSFNKVSNETSSGEIALLKVAGNPSSGQFSVLPAPSNGNNLFEIVLSGDQLDKIGGVAADKQIIHLEMEEEASGIVSHAYMPFYIDNEPPTVRMHNPVIIGDFNNDGIVDTNDISNPVLTPLMQDCGSICIKNNLHGDSCIEAQSLCRHIDSVARYPQNSYSDGIDNNFNGNIDKHDKTEFDRIQYYSPKFNGNILSSKPVDISFSIFDNLQESQSAKTLEWRIYKIGGDDFNASSDQLIFSKPITSGKNFGIDYDDSWKFEGINKTSPDNGLYCVVVYVQDQAGNEQFGAPGYFIIDTRAPDITVKQFWQDERHNIIFSASSSTFMLRFVPGNGYVFANKYASEAVEVTATFKPLGAWSFYPQKSITVPVNYQDLVAFNSTGDSVTNFSPDGQIDPTVIFLEKEINSMAGYFYLPDAHYSVTLTARDKAENEKTIAIANEMVVQTGNTTPAMNNYNMNINGITSFNDSTNVDSLTSTQDALGTDFNDSYNYSSLKISGDFTFCVRVKSISNTSPDAMAGIMVRKSLDDDDVHALIAATVSGNIIYRTRMAKGDRASSQPAISGYAVPNVWLKVERKGDTLQSYMSHDGITYMLAGKMAIGTGDVYVGYFHTPNCTGCTGSATFGEIKFIPYVVAPVDLIFQKIGTVISPIGEWNSTFDRYTLGGASSGIGGTNDAFEFSSIRLGGDFSFSVKVESLDTTSLFAKAGLMARATLADNSIHGSIEVTSANRAEFEYRPLTGGTSIRSTVAGFPPASTWCRLSRIAGILFGYAGPDTNHLQLIGQFAIGFDSLYVGIVHTSNNANVYGTAIFSNLSIVTKIPGPQLLSLNKPAFASTYENESCISLNVTDGDTIEKRWSPLRSDNQWLIIDLENICQISSINIFWAEAAAREYDIQVSDYGKIWSNIKHIRDHKYDKRVDRFTNLARQGRYLRIFGMRQQTMHGYSIYEIQVMGTPGSETPATKFSNQFTQVTASSFEKGNLPKYVVDDDYTTQWKSEYKCHSDPDRQWITLDLGSIRKIDNVYLEWGNAYGKNYDI
jgi:hypothetical protein